MKTRLILFVALIAAVISCEKTPQEEGEGTIVTNPMIEAPSVQFDIITMTASSEEPDTKTTLSGQSVLWDENDQIRVSGAQTMQTLTTTVNGVSQGLGIKLSQSSTKAYIKYDYIKVVLNGRDITNDITTGAHNSFMLGTYSNGGYVYAKAGEIITVDVNTSNNVIPLV